MPIQKYLSGYSVQLVSQIQNLLESDQLTAMLLKKYPKPHTFTNNQSLREYALALKNQYMKKSQSLSKVMYDDKIHVVNNALGLHTYVSRVQGGKLKSKNELRVSSVLKRAPEPFLNMVVVHELAHLKEKEHNKSFYRLCEHMLPNYHQLEFDMRVYLIQIELGGPIY